MQCDACGSTDTRDSFVQLGFAHRECRRCKLLFVWPPPSREQLRAAYTSGSGIAGEPLSIACWEGSSRHLGRTWASLLDTVRRTAGRGPLLDVGCGSGQFLAFAARAGWSDLVGLEPAALAAAAARKATDALIIEADLPAAKLAGARFAAIVAWDVIEHVPDLAGFLAEAARLLRPGGALLVSTVHRGGLALRVLGRRALVVRPPEHLRYFATKSLRAALTAAGLRVSRLWTQDVYLREWTRAWTRAAGPSVSERVLYRKVYDRFTASRVLSGMMVATNALLGATGLGDEVFAVARRPSGPG